MAPLSLDEAASQIAAALSARPPRRVSVDGFERAAVLVPLLARPGEPTLLFTRRTELVTRHRGEISFPGGHLEPGEGPRDAALREAREEVALEPASVEVLGELDERPTVTSYVVTPVVGLVRYPPERFRRQGGEVAEVFEVPLATLAAPGLPRGEWWHRRRGFRSGGSTTSPRTRSTAREAASGSGSSTWRRIASSGASPPGS